MIKLIKTLLLVLLLPLLTNCFRGSNIYVIDDPKDLQELKLIHSNNSEKILRNKEGDLIIDFRNLDSIYISNDLEDLTNGIKTVFKFNNEIFSTQELENKLNIRVTQNAVISKKNDSIFIKKIEIIFIRISNF